MVHFYHAGLPLLLAAWIGVVLLATGRGIAQSGVFGPPTPVVDKDKEKPVSYIFYTYMT